MAFLGLFGNYSKPGPGVSKEEEELSPVTKFFVVYYRRMSKFMQLNLIFMLPFMFAVLAAVAMFILPIPRWVLSATFGNVTFEINTWLLYGITLPFFLLAPFWGGLMVVSRRMAKEEYSFVWSEYWTGVKDNWKQFLANGIILYVIYLFTSFSLIYYNARIYDSWFFIIPIALIIAIVIITLFSQYYVNLLIVCVELKLPLIYKNAFIFSLMGIKSNFILSITFIISLGLMFALFMLNILTVLIAVAIAILFLFSFLSYANCFICYPLIVKYIIDPVTNPQEEKQEEAIMKDFSFEESLSNIALKAGELQEDDDAPKYVYINGKLVKSEDVDK